MENMSIFTRSTNLTPEERACAEMVKKTLKLVEEGLLTGMEGSMKVWGAREILMSLELKSKIWLDMMKIELELAKRS